MPCSYKLASLLAKQSETFDIRKPFLTSIFHQPHRSPLAERNGNPMVLSGCIRTSITRSLWRVTIEEYGLALSWLLSYWPKMGASGWLLHSSGTVFHSRVPNWAVGHRGAAYSIWLLANPMKHTANPSWPQFEPLRHASPTTDCASLCRKWTIFHRQSPLQSLQKRVDVIAIQQRFADGYSIHEVFWHPNIEIWFTSNAVNNTNFVGWLRYEYKVWRFFFLRDFHVRFLFRFVASTNCDFLHTSVRVHAYTQTYTHSNTHTTNGV